MDKLNDLLSVLKENGLNKTYTKVMTDLADIKSALSVVNEEVNDAILGLLSEGRYEDVNKLTSIPAMSSNVVVELEGLLNGFLFEKTVKSIEKENVVKEDKVSEEPKKEEKILEYSGIITSKSGLKKGAKVMHKIYGLGEVVNMEDSKDGKVLRVFFSSCGEKPFNCTSEILSKYFNIECNIDEKVIGGQKEIAYNLYTNPELFRFKKPYKIKIFESTYDVKSWRDAAVVLLKFLYKADSKAFLELKEMGIYFEGNKSSENILRFMASVAEQYLNVLNRPVRKNVNLFIREE